MSSLLFGRSWTPGSAPPSDERVFRGYFPELDCVRGLSVMVVVLTHYLYPHVPAVFDLAWALMDMFFVMSGFLVGGILLDTVDRSGFIQRFYLRRAVRILPLYYLVLTVMFVYSARWDPEYPKMLEAWGSPWWFAICLGNLPTALTGEMPKAMGFSFGPLWSVQIEEQFYLLAPLLIFWVRREKLAKALPLLAILSLALRCAVYAWTPDNVEVQYVLLPLHLDGLVLGILLALQYRMGWSPGEGRELGLRTVGWWAATLIPSAIAGHLYTGPGLAPFHRTLGFFFSSVASAHLVLWLVKWRGCPVTRPFRCGPLVYLGRIAYGIYLLHMPVRAILRGLEYFAARPASLFWTSLTLTLLLASLSWRFFERPLLKWRDRVS